MRNQVEEYLKGAQPYEIGCSLFLALTNNRMYALRLMANDTEPNRLAIAYELKQWLQEQPGYWESIVESEENEIIEPEPDQPVQPRELVIYTPAPVVSNSSSPVSDKLLGTRASLYRERGHLHGRLHEAATDEDRYAIQKQMVPIQKKINLVNRELRQLESGVLPTQSLQQSMTAEEYKRVANVQAYIRRYQRQLATEPDPKKKADINEKIAKYEGELTAIKG